MDERNCPICGDLITPDNERSKNSKCIRCWNEYSADLKETHKINNNGRVKDATKNQDCKGCNKSHPQTWFNVDDGSLNWFDRSCVIHSRIFHYKKNSQKSGKGYSLDTEYACTLMKLPCYMCDGWSYEDAAISGLDRMNSDVGYTKMNVRPACTACNIAKNVSSIHDHYKRMKHFTLNYEKEFPGAILLNLYYDDELDFSAS